MRLLQLRYFANPLFTLIVTLLFAASSSYASVQRTCKEIFGISATYKTLTVKNVEKSIIYSKGIQRARRILKLTSEEYEKAVLADQVPPDVFLMVDKLPLHIDFPIVAGAFILSPLTALGSHIQLQAEKMGIPLVYLASSTQILEIAMIARQNQHVLVEVDGNIKIHSSKSSFADPNPTHPPAVLPAKTNRSVLNVYSTAQGRQASGPLEIVGSKYSPLADLHQRHPSIRMPEPLSLSSGYYEAFLDHSTYRGQRLREVVGERTQKIEHLQDETTVAALLKEIRDAFEHADSKQVFPKILQDLKNAGLNPQARYSIRSNNELEDHIGSGVFNSAIAKNLSLEELSRAIKSVWSSMYTYRSYGLRRAWRLSEENLSMPVLIHEYIENEELSGTGNFFYHNGQLTLKANIVIGNQSKATNPSQYAESYSFEIQENPRGETNLSRLRLRDPAIENQMLRMFKSLKKAVVEDFKTRTYRPVSIDIEFLVDESGAPILMQYKRRQSREIVFNMMKGKIKLADAEKTFPLSQNKDEQSILNALRESNFDVLSTNDLPNLGKSYRIALIRIKGKDRLITWIGTLHEDAERIVTATSSQIKWVVGGYVTTSPDRPGVLWLEPSGAFAFLDINFYYPSILAALHTEYKTNPIAFEKIHTFEFFDSHMKLVHSAQTISLESFKP